MSWPRPFFFESSPERSRCLRTSWTSFGRSCAWSIPMRTAIWPNLRSASRAAVLTPHKDVTAAARERAAPASDLEVEAEPVDRRGPAVAVVARVPDLLEERPARDAERELEGVVALDDRL